MRALLWIFGCFWSVCIGSAQAPPAIDLRPDVTVVIKEQQIGGELVNLTYRSPKVTQQTVLQQIAALGQELGVGARGPTLWTQSFGSAADQKLVKAQFGIDGLIDRQNGTLNLQAIARAFAGVAAPDTIDAIQVIFDGERATDRTIQSFSNDSVSLDGKLFTSPPSIEYLVILKTQDKAKISVPTSHEQPKITAPPPPAPSPITLNVLLTLVVIASIALGALVYFLVVSRGPSGGSGSSRLR